MAPTTSRGIATDTILQLQIKMPSAGHNTLTLTWTSPRSNGNCQTKSDAVCWLMLVWAATHLQQIFIVLWVLALDLLSAGTSHFVKTTLTCFISRLSGTGGRRRRLWGPAGGGPLHWEALPHAPAAFSSFLCWWTPLSMGFSPFLSLVWTKWWFQMQFYVFIILLLKCILKSEARLTSLRRPSCVFLNSMGEIPRETLCFSLFLIKNIYLHSFFTS